MSAQFALKFVSGLKFIAAIAAITTLAVSSAAAKAAANDPWVYIPGGMAKTDGSIGYIAGAMDSVEAIDMASGRPIWDCKKALRPLAIAGDSVVAMGQRIQNRPNVMSVVVLDAANGQVLKESELIEFPDWIAVDGGIGLQFVSTAGIDNGDLIIRWQAVRQSIQPGPQVTAEVIAASRKNSTGIARVNLETGKAQVIEDGVLTPPNLPRLGKYTDVGGKRLQVTESTEKVPGGITLLRRTMDATDKASGRPMWQHEIAGEVILPDTPPTAQQNQPQQRQQRVQQQQTRPPAQQSMQPRRYPQR